MQRRHFITSGIAMLACAASGAAAAMTDGGGAVRQLSAAGFSAMINDTFMLYDRVRVVGVKLVKVREARAAPGTQQFTLSFAGSDADSLDSGIVEVDHPATGRMLMYMDVSRRGQHGMLYRADFNLLA